jgi:hypothetical protein
MCMHQGCISIEALPRPDALTAAQEGLRHLRACLGASVQPHLELSGGNQ